MMKIHTEIFNKLLLSWCLLLLCVTLFTLSGCMGQRFGEITGVVNLEDEEIHEGVEVALLGTQFRSLTDEDGHFSFIGIVPGRYTMLIEEDGYESVRQAVDINTKEYQALDPIILVKQYVPEGSLSGYITLPGEESHENITVMLTGTIHSTRTNRSGHFLIQDIQPGDFTLIAIKPGWLPYSEENIVIEDGTETQLGEVELESVQSIAERVSRQQATKARFAIRGVVYLQGKSNFEGTKVYPQDDPDTFTFTDQQGSFELVLFSDEPRVVEFSHQGYVDHIWEDIEPVPVNESKRHGITTLRIEEAQEESRGLLQGYVFLQSETAFANTIVSLDGVSQKVSTDSSGRYMFIGVQPGNYTLFAEHPGYQTGRLVGLEISADQITRATDITLTPIDDDDDQGLGSVVGIALVEDGDDHGGISVALEGTSFNTVSASDGRYEFNQVPYGAYTLLFSKGGYKNEYIPGIRVAAGQTTELQPIALVKDVEPPTVIETFPRNGARNAPIVQHVDVLVRFSDRMLAESVKNSVIIEPPVSFDAFFDRESELSDMDVLHLRLYQNAPQPVVFKTRYQVIILPQAQTPQGAKMEEPYQFAFTTDGPLITGTIPLPNEDSFFTNDNSPIVIETNALVDPSSVERAIRFRPEPDAMPLYEFIQTDTGSRIIIKTNLRSGTRYSLRIDNTLRTMDKSRFSNTPYVLSFRTMSFGGERPRPSRGLR